MKWVARIGLVAILVLLLIGVGIVFYGGAIIRQGVETAGSNVTGVPVTLEAAHFFPLRGKAGLSGLTISNPEGFKTGHLIKLDGVDVEIDMSSLRTDTVVIKSVEIREPDVSYEMSLKGSNFKALLKGMEGGPDTKPGEGESKSEKPNSTPSSEEPGGEGGRKVMIEKFKILNGTVRISSKILQGRNAAIPLPDIELENIGKENEGASLPDVIQIVLGEVASAVTSLASGIVGVAGQGVKAVGGGAIEGVKSVGQGVAVVGEGAIDEVIAVGEGAVDGVIAVGAGAAKGVQSVGKGVGAVGEGAVGGVKAVSAGAAEGLKKAVGSGAGSLVKGVGGLFGGNREDGEASKEEQSHSE